MLVSHAGLATAAEFAATEAEVAATASEVTATEARASEGDSCDLGPGDLLWPLASARNVNSVITQRPFTPLDSVKLVQTYIHVSAESTWIIALLVDVLSCGCVVTWTHSM